jgi:uncharacterized membrane protein YdjX (TVP38/TMEM64 family)
MEASFEIFLFFLLLIFILSSTSAIIFAISYQKKSWLNGLLLGCFVGVIVSLISLGIVFLLWLN